MVSVINFYFLCFSCIIYKVIPDNFSFQYNERKNAHFLTISCFVYTSSTMIKISRLSLALFLPASPKAKAGLGVQSLRPSVRPSVPISCHRNSSETTADPIKMKLGMQIGHHMVLCISAGNFDPLIFVGVMPLGTQRIFINQLTI